jgi:hypothetical protein
MSGRNGPPGRNNRRIARAGSIKNLGATGFPARLPVLLILIFFLILILGDREEIKKKITSKIKN